MALKSVYEATDVDAEVLQAAEEASEWFDGRIDWDDYWDRLEQSGVFVGDMASPAAVRIQRHVRDFRRET